MTTRNTKAAASPEADLPSAWGDAPVEIMSGRDLTDKADLIDTPFLIIGVQFEQSVRDYMICYVYALDAHGTEFVFSDTSTTGIRFQIEQFLTNAGRPEALTSGEFEPMRVAVMKGLRVSEFDAQVQVPGKAGGPGRTVTKQAKTYYLTTSGRPATAR
jgi:hypothetical protein